MKSDPEGQFFLAPDKSESNKYYLNFKVKSDSTSYENSQLFLKRAREQCQASEPFVSLQYERVGDETITVTNGAIYVPVSREVTRYSGVFYCNPEDWQIAKKNEIKRQKKELRTECEATDLLPSEFQVGDYQKNCMSIEDQFKLYLETDSALPVQGGSQ